MRRNSAKRIYLIFIVVVLGACNTYDQKKTTLPAMQKESGISDGKDSLIDDHDYEENDPLSMSGTLICAHCFALDQENVGLDHQLPESGFIPACASRCAELGYPIAVLVDPPIAGNEVWVIRTSSQLFTDYMAQKAEVVGTFVTNGMIEPRSIQVPTEPGRRQIIL
ncbi:MAG: hypothetical protein ACR2MX_00250 [Cyclobacteriaceae bacterium]